jgi:hypothetical protein
MCYHLPSKNASCVIVVLVAIFHKAPAIHVTYVRLPSLTPQQVKTTHFLPEGQRDHPSYLFLLQNTEGMSDGLAEPTDVVDIPS